MISPFLVNVIVYLIIFIVLGVFLKIRPNYRKNVLYILGNIKLLYKNYIHWTISKFIIYIYGWVLAGIASIPFVALMVFFLYKTAGIIKPEWINTYINENRIDYGVVTAIFQHPFLMISAIVVLVIIFLIFVFSFMYAYFLQQKVYINYLEGKKLPFFSKSFIDWKTMAKYFGIIFWVTMYLLIPIGIAFFYLLMLLGLSKIPALSPIIFGENLAIGIFQLIVFASIFIYFIYIGIRLSFAYICLLYTTDSSRSSLSYTKESLAITKGKVWKIIGLGIPFLFISILLDAVFTLLEQINSFMPFVMNIVDFFVFSGMSFMIYISLYRVIVGKTVNKTDRITVSEVVTENPIELNKEPKTETKKPAIKIKKKTDSVDINKL